MSPLSDEDGQILLRVARRALEEAVSWHRLPAWEGFSGEGLGKAGAFVTLRKHASLRGCIGQVEPREPLVRVVAECAVAAALHDPRFPPVTPPEIPELSIEVSVLSPLFDIRPEEIEVGRHGLLISSGLERGLLLPQVALEWNWDRERFLQETCRKAGLPGDTWRRGARLQAFTTRVFAETHQKSTPSPRVHVSARGADRP